MQRGPSQQPTSGTSHPRRDFLKTGATAMSATALAATFPARAGAFVDGSEILRVGLVGCGGRGTGAAREALKADPYTRLVAMGDVFRSQIDTSINALNTVEEIADHVAVEEDYKFIGLDAFQKVIDNVDVVLLATPPGFRPVHLRAAVEAGKQIFTEKPMATDAPGVRSVIESVEIARQKNLGLCAGFCWRYDYARRALFEKLHAGAIGDILAVYGTYLTGPVKPMPPADTRPPGISDLEWMVRNWYNFTWLSGDGLVEQAVHTVDWLAWSHQDNPPASCTAVGGRQIPANGGNIFDHIEVNYVWEDETRGFLAQRQMDGCYSENRLYVLGTKGKAEIGPRGVSISGEETWRYKGPSNNMYQTEHDEFFLSIRDGKPINDGDRMWKSTLMGIMGRMAGYTGQQVTWDDALNSEVSLVPEITNGWDTPVEFRPIARPGVDGRTV
ncbi:MAG: gfo/Idh/MocA family oxidoreductase [Planctomycetota bacterium]|nr:MAG: gfo/Idh/MocA family oxidoreductase [Planctomycetota bacterium]REK26416.1 MAG: gfo/Idh/MocA family oxidoreductase [Planctomycetota bacterium]REK32049.1 MAG: gfo/Idh/MocA family oxidoreductase [Planctomycetota bacterium]